MERETKVAGRFADVSRSGRNGAATSTVKQPNMLNGDDEILAHRADDGRYQSLADHLRQTAEMAEAFSASFGAEAWGRAAGLLHDDGKALERFQRRIRGEHIQADHSTPGAKYAAEHMRAPKGYGKLIAYCVAGHHAGLPDGDSGEDPSCLAKRLARAETGPGHLAQELPNRFEQAPFQKIRPRQEEMGFSCAFFTRMLYSSLVDADFLDTERFCSPEKSEKRGAYPELSILKKQLDDHLTQLSNSAKPSQVNRLRARILAESRAAADLEPGLFSLTVPTGGGKTLSSLSFALDHAAKWGLRRVIYVIPYTSIIEQTANTFRGIFGDAAVLEHHTNIVREENGEDDEREERRLLAAENWDAPIVVTTNVQFFESFFANRSSKTRRLHNVAQSVVILDEAQMLPVPYLRPCLAVLRELSARYGSSLVLCTATQPALTARDDFRNGLAGVREMMSDPHGLEMAFQRVSAQLLGEVEDAEIIRRVVAEPQCLCIVSTRKHARELFRALEGEDGVFHLSASMCPAHRTRILGTARGPAPGTIRRRLLDGEPCRVVSTQLVEAGVDVDFPVVFRAMAGVDSIVQAAGRCNREGRLLAPGRLYVFSSSDNPPPRLFRQNVQTAELIMRGREDRLLSEETVKAYFRELFWLKDLNGGLDAERILESFSEAAIRGDFPFKYVASVFRIISDSQSPVIIPFDERAAELCRALRFAEHPGGILRKLQPYTIQVFPDVLRRLREVGYVEAAKDGQYDILTDFGLKEAYDDRFGLNPEIREFYEVENLIL